MPSEAHWEKKAAVRALSAMEIMGVPQFKPGFEGKLEDLAPVRNQPDKYETGLIRAIKDCALDDPEDPPAVPLKDLRLAVAEALGFKETADEKRKLRAYSALGTPLHTQCGVSGFFEYNDPKAGGFARTLIEVAANSDSPYGNGADVMIDNLPDANLAEDAYLAKIESLGRDIAKKLRAVAQAATRAKQHR